MAKEQSEQPQADNKELLNTINLVLNKLNEYWKIFEEEIKVLASNEKILLAHDIALQSILNKYVSWEKVLPKEEEKTSSLKLMSNFFEKSMTVEEYQNFIQNDAKRYSGLFSKALQEVINNEVKKSLQNTQNQGSANADSSIGTSTTTNPSILPGTPGSSTPPPAPKKIDTASKTLSKTTTWDDKKFDEVFKDIQNVLAELPGSYTYKTNKNESTITVLSKKITPICTVSPVEVKAVDINPSIGTWEVMLKSAATAYKGKILEIHLLDRSQLKAFETAKRELEKSDPSF
jgi:hypothetical protein